MLKDKKKKNGYNSNISLVIALKVWPWVDHIVSFSCSIEKIKKIG